MLEGRATGLWPSCRAARYLDYLQPSRGESPHDKRFRLTVDEARRDGTVAVLSSNLELAKEVYGHLLSVARAITLDEVARKDFDTRKIELGILTSDLMKWMKQPSSSDLTPAKSDANEKTIKVSRGKRVTVNQRMSEYLSLIHI